MDYTKMTKNQLMEYMNEHSVFYLKSWNKNKMIKHIVELEEIEKNGCLYPSLWDVDIK